MKILLKNATQIKLKNRRTTVVSEPDGNYTVELVRMKETKEPEITANVFEVKGKAVVSVLRLSETGAISLLAALQSELERNHNIKSKY